MPATFRLSDLRDLAAAVERCRRLLDADCDPVAVERRCSRATRCSARWCGAPGLRVPGHVDGDELAVRAVLGQQVTVAGAPHRRPRLRRRARHGAGVPTATPADGLTHLFPTRRDAGRARPRVAADAAGRGRALIALCRALADGDVRLDRGADRDDVRRRLLALPGIGPWTADYIALRALGHPDVFLPTDIGIRDAPAAGSDATRRRPSGLAERWRPWRSYAQLPPLARRSLPDARTKGH